jgi:hypothetical protein
VIATQGLGRYDHGLVGDLGLIKLASSLRGRCVHAWETEELLEPYGEWQGLASALLLIGFSRGLVPGADADVARLVRATGACARPESAPADPGHANIPEGGRFAAAGAGGSHKPCKRRHSA